MFMSSRQFFVNAENKTFPKRGAEADFNLEAAVDHQKFM